MDRHSLTRVAGQKGEIEKENRPEAQYISVVGSLRWKLRMKTENTKKKCELKNII